MFVIVRHGNTFEAGEAPRRIGARTDLPLTAKGRDQARALGRHFADQGLRFTRTHVSPLLRTRETAQLILAEQADAPDMQMAAWLREIEHGPDENQTEEAVLARIGQHALDQWDHAGIAPPGWTVDREARIAAWQALFAQSDDPAPGATLIVTSNGAARFALLADENLVNARQNLTSMKLPTGGYGIIQRSDTGSLAVAPWGERP